MILSLSRTLLEYPALSQPPGGLNVQLLLRIAAPEAEASKRRPGDNGIWFVLPSVLLLLALPRAEILLKHPASRGGE